MNKNIYYQIPRYLLALIFSNQRRNSKYSATKTELKKGFYFTVEIPATNIILKIPFKAVLKDNTKIKGIKGFNFSSATHCRSYHLGYCQIKNKCDCYAVVGEERNKNDINQDGTLKINSLHQIKLNMLFNNKIKQDSKLLNQFITYLNQTVKYLRFNVNGDFRNAEDVQLLKQIVKNYNGISYGYTAADYLYKDLQELKQYTAINGSNLKYTNRYKVTYLLSEYYQAILNNRNCLGGCINCCKCWKLQNVEILNLFHKKDADVILNTPANQEFITALLRNHNITIYPKDLKLKGIYSSINHHLKQYNKDLQKQDINNIKDLLNHLAKKKGAD